MSTKVAKFVSTIAVHFPPPRFDSPEQEAEWLRSIIESLKSYDESVLDRACQWIIDHRGLKANEKWFPVPAEIRKVCNEIIDEDRRVPLLRQAAAEIFDGKKAPPHSRARTALVLDLLKGEMGREAARDGWIGSLVDYVRHAKELPDGSMIRTIKARAVEFQEIRQRCHHGVGWPSTPQGKGLARACAIWGDTIEARNRLWARVILGNEDEEAIFRFIEKDDELRGAA
jgi:hypothetical protein